MIVAHLDFHLIVMIKNVWCQILRMIFNLFVVCHLSFTLMTLNITEYRSCDAAKANVKSE